MQSTRINVVSMAWQIEEHAGVVVVSMRSNAVNKINPIFFEGLNHAWDRLEQEYPRMPIVLTSVGSTFSAGLDFEDVFPRFAQDTIESVYTWFEQFRAAILRVLTSPRPVIAAINGHAFAGGLILALCCDWRIAARSSSQFSLNEVAIGIPMPGTFTEIIRYAIGSKTAAEAILRAHVYNVDQALEKGFVHSVVNPAQLLETAMHAANEIAFDCFDAYVISKQALLAPVLKTIYAESFEFDRKAIQGMCLSTSTQAQKRALMMLKQRARAT